MQLLIAVTIELKRNRMLILDAWQRKPIRKAEIKNQPSCGDQILKYNILLQSKPTIWPTTFYL